MTDRKQLTTGAGQPVVDNQNSITVGERGPPGRGSGSYNWWDDSLQLPARASAGENNEQVRSE